MTDPIINEIVSYLKRSTSIRLNGCPPQTCSLDSLDSLEMFGFINFIENSFGITVLDREVRPEHFDTVAATAQFINRKRGGIN
ncbi:MAG: acyl carrier protein [Candidatus Eisenbacteria bacterium]|uniref:Acyl carrier protein n=1 Tax=Eiseniibacteriota bacterium TaxID=2212470 RepID=A0A948RZU3_UNCEI|nr:acyl carrier protein [Candidatus Eisenbacteria bacterium]MBU1949042.1 acyl carrier protein [Candidatus Eisenbacteria bacterium]MBU2692624.1 acyl carrier protein [Candidatus Eisenbacteria bacterium]